MLLLIPSNMVFQLTPYIIPMIDAIAPENIRANWLDPERDSSPYRCTFIASNPIKNKIGVRDNK